jgi:hypothetical protein
MFINFFLEQLKIRNAADGIKIGLCIEKQTIMKKLLTSAVFVIVVSAVTNAQKLNFGGKLGANLTKISGQAFKEGYSLGYHVGAFAEIDLGKSWGIQPELLWNQTNTKPASSTNQVLNGWKDNTKDIKLNYITIPLLLRFNVAPVLTLNLGPQYGILLNKDESLWSNGKQAFKSGDFSLTAGATVNLSKLRFYGRYNVGLNDINDVDNQDKWRSQQMQFGVGVAL